MDHGVQVVGSVEGVGKVQQGNRSELVVVGNGRKKVQPLEKGNPLVMAAASNRSHPIDLEVVHSRRTSLLCSRSEL